MGDGISVRGGADGIEAHRDDIHAVAALLRHAGHAMDDAAAELQLLTWSDEWASLRYEDPFGTAAIEQDLVGFGGLGTRIAGRAEQWQVLALFTDAAADRYGRADDGVLGAIRHAASSFAHHVETLAVAEGRSWVTTFEHGPLAGTQTLLAEDPDFVTWTRDVLQASGLLALLRLGLPDGHARVRSTGVDAGAADPPRDLAGLLTELERRNETRSGEIDVRIMIGADGHRYVVVDIPGTKSWNPYPDNHDITSPSTNLRAIAGSTTAYEQGVLQAMRRAGVRPTDDVMLVGHSQGGMVAVQTAIDATHSGQFHVTHVVTAGSPIAALAGRVPAGVQVLALENEGDVVPELDGAPNAPAVNVTTVTVHHNHDYLGDNHGLDTSYIPGARDVDASTDPSVRTFLAGAAGFFTARSAQTHTYVITREFSTAEKAELAALGLA